MLIIGDQPPTTYRLLRLGRLLYRLVLKLPFGRGGLYLKAIGRLNGQKPD